MRLDGEMRPRCLTDAEVAELTAGREQREEMERMVRMLIRLVRPGFAESSEASGQELAVPVAAEAEPNVRNYAFVLTVGHQLVLDSERSVGRASESRGVKPPSALVPAFVAAA